MTVRPGRAAIRSRPGKGPERPGGRRVLPCLRNRKAGHGPAADPSVSTTTPFPYGVSATLCPRWTSRPVTAACTTTRIPSLAPPPPLIGRKREEPVRRRPAHHYALGASLTRSPGVLSSAWSTSPATSSTPLTSVLKKGRTHRSEPRGPKQARFQEAHPVGRERTAPGRRHLGRQHSRQPGAEAHGGGSPSEARPPSRPVLQASAPARGQSL